MALEPTAGEHCPQPDQAPGGSLHRACRFIHGWDITSQTHSHPPGPQGVHRVAHTHAGGEGTLAAAAAALHLPHTPLHACHVVILTCWTIPIPSFLSAPPQPPPPTLEGTTLHALLQGPAGGLSSRPGCKPLAQWARPSEPSQSSLSPGHARQHHPNPGPRSQCSRSTRSQTLAQLPHGTGQALGQGHLQVSTQGGPPRSNQQPKRLWERRCQSQGSATRRDVAFQQEDRGAGWREGLQ